MNVDFVDYQEATSIKVGRMLLSKGFAIASCTGVAESTLRASESLGVLTKSPATEPKRYLFGLIKAKSRRRFLGVIWFRNDVRGATDADWVFEVYGREHVSQTKQLADELAKTFNVKISLRLVREEPDTETFMADTFRF